MYKCTLCTSFYIGGFKECVFFLKRGGGWWWGVNADSFIYTMLREPLGVRCRLRRGSGGMYWCGWL